MTEQDKLDALIIEIVTSLNIVPSPPIEELIAELERLLREGE